MRRFLFFLGVFSMLSSCLNLEDSNPYQANLHQVELQLVLPAGFNDLKLEGVMAELKDNANGLVFEGVSDSRGVISINVPNGVYSATLSAEIDNEIFNASKQGIVVSGKPATGTLNLLHSKTGDIVIKEIYCGGCMKLPVQGVYNADSYIIVHNNSDKLQYLDGLCFATVDPYNSNSSTVWPEESTFAPLIQAVWQIPGDGSSHPLNPGEDAVIVVYGAIDHSATYPLSVNLDKEDYFVCYNELSFWNTSYHPAPGANIRKDHILDVVLKMGKANAYTFSINSPAVVIFRAENQSIKDFVSSSDNVIQKSGSDDRIVCLPNEWIIDGVEVFNGQATNNKKRISASVDAGYVVLSNTHESRTLMRRVNETKSQKLGYEVLVDTNNSSRDFYERQSQSLHE